MTAKKIKKATTTSISKANAVKSSKSTASVKLTPASSPKKPTTKKSPVKKPVAKAPAVAKFEPAVHQNRRIVLERAEYATASVNKHLSGFIDFLREQSVVGLAIGLVMGTQVKQLVDSLINSFINPLVGILLPGKGALDQKTFVLMMHGKKAIFAWGAFVATLISFVIVAAVIYFTFKLLKLDKLTKKKDK